MNISRITVSSTTSMGNKIVTRSVDIEITAGSADKTEIQSILEDAFFAIAQTNHTESKLEEDK